MNAQTQIKADWFASFTREREYSERIEKQLSRSNALLRMECDRRKFRGEDVAHIEAFLRECAQ